LHRERVLHKEAARQVARFLTAYAETKSIDMKINYVNPDHVHALVDLPTRFQLSN